MQVLFLIVAVGANLTTPQFSNPVYPGISYTGSRLLETNYSSNAYVDVEWTQSTTIDASTGTTYIANSQLHVISAVPASSTYINYPGLGHVYAGSSGSSGNHDGSVDVAKFNSPKGIAIYTPTGGHKYLFVADTGNHCIKRVDLTTGSVLSVAGVAGSRGLRDGDGRKALFDSPTSLGVDQISGLIFVLDNASRIRMIYLSEESGTMTVKVSTMVPGACRAIASSTTYSTVIKRTVRCMTGWVANSAGASLTTIQWAWPSVCLGNSVTCSTRYELCLNFVWIIL